MMNKYTVLLVALGLGLTTTLKAQKTSGGYFEGMARALVSNQSVLGDTARNDAETTGGYTLFDLGINAVRDDVIKINSILRVKNEFGGFFGDGVFFEFRQLRLEGVIGEKIKYEMGDIDLKSSKYTLFNSEVDYNRYESELFTIKRDIIDYENFYMGENTWRLQGVNMYTTFLFDKAIEKLKVRVFGNRVLRTDLVGIPDRFLFGGDITAIQSKNLEVGFNSVFVSDIEQTLPSSTVDFDNGVYSLDVAFNKDLNDDLNLLFDFEGGASNTSAFFADSNETVEYNGAFYDVSVGAGYKPFGLTLKAGYRSVDVDFNSPGAQTRRIYDFANATPAVNNLGEQITPDRGASLWDRATQEFGLYNSRSLSSRLLAFDPIYGNINPYGDATPNRQGLFVNLEATDDSLKLYDARLAVTAMSEQIGVGVEEKRSFTGIEVGGKLMINQLLAKENTIAIHAGLRNESTSRDGAAPIELTSTMMDIGIDFEPLKRLHVLLGYKTLTASGNEYFYNGSQEFTRNQYNQIDTSATFSSKDIDITDNIIAIGFKYVFSDNAFVSIQGNFVAYEDRQFVQFTPDETDPVNNPPVKVVGPRAYDINQLYLVYVQRF